MAEWVVSDEDLGCDGAYFSYKEIVRCKDCKFWGESLTEEERNECDVYADLVCTYWMSDGLTRDDFCSKGERRENEISIMDYSDMPGDTISTEYGPAHDDESSDEG